MSDFIKLFSSVLLILAVAAMGPFAGDVWAGEPERTIPDWPKCPEENGKDFPDWFPKLLGAQFDGIYQNMPPFHSPYQGANSLSFLNSRGHDVTNAYGLYFGSQLTSRLQLYVDFELFQGDGVSNGLGLGGYVNGDFIRAGSSNLPKVPYVARCYLRYYYPLSGEMEKVERGIDQMPGDQPVSRLQTKVGWFSAPDDFDQNRYANNNRTQFFNYDFLYNPAWDFAQNTRGYTAGFLTALYQPRWRVAFGAYWEPNSANGASYDTNTDSFQEIGYNLELDYKLNGSGTIVRLLSYLNMARMGNYDEALARAAGTGTAPSLFGVERLGGTKYGFGLNFEQPLADDGETGMFGRLGWNDGHYETWEYTECDRAVSLGAQLSGIHWKRDEDRVGIAYGVEGLSNAHKDYLAAGGYGILIGDGALNYGLEQVFEIYYRIQVCSFAQLSPDFQFIQNPGYNRDRGPAEVYGIRLHVYY